MSGKLTFTYQTRPFHDDALLILFEEYATLMSSVVRHLFAAMASGKKSTDLKSRYLQQFQITARQFNSCRVSVEGKRASIQSLQSSNIKNIEYLKKLLKIVSILYVNMFGVLYYNRRAT